MELTFAPRGILQINDARIIFRNFSGLGSQYNREGDRNFSLLISGGHVDGLEMAQNGPRTATEIADILVSEGWNVKIKPPKEDGDDPFMYLPVKVKFNDRGPNAYLISNGRKNKLEEEDIHMLDHVDILSVDLDVRPYDWEVNGKEGRSAYLQAIQVTQRVNDRFADEEEMPFEEE